MLERRITHIGASPVVQRLTDAAIRAAKPGPQTTYHWDGELPGFGYRLTKTGVKTFVVLLGRGNRRTLGRYPILTVHDARSAAKRLIAERTLGKAQTPRIGHSRASADFLADCAQRLRPKTVRNYKDTLRLQLDFGTQLLDTITPEQIRRKLQGLTPSQKEHAIRVGKTYFTWLLRHGMIEKSPMALMQNRLQPSRERVLSDTELAAVYRTALQRQTPFHKIVALLILTGQRRGEIAALRWEWIKNDGIIEIPHAYTKNKHTHHFPINSAAQRVIESIPRTSTYCFPATRERKVGTPSTIFAGWGKPKAAFDRECRVTGWRIHDLRRTFATNLQRLGVRIEVTERILNHVSGTRAGVAGIYNRYDWLPEAREALLKYEAFLATLTPQA